MHLHSNYSMRTCSVVFWEAHPVRNCCRALGHFCNMQYAIWTCICILTIRSVPRSSLSEALLQGVGTLVSCCSKSAAHCRQDPKPDCCVPPRYSIELKMIQPRTNLKWCICEQAVIECNGWDGETKISKIYWRRKTDKLKIYCDVCC